VCGLTIVGGVREAWSDWLRGRWKTVCARVARPTLLCGPSTSPLEAMRRARRTIDSLEYVELGFLLDEAGVRFTEDQLARLKPYLMSAHGQEAVLGQLRTKARIFARCGTAALAVDDTFATLLVGHSDGHSPLQNVERYASPELALRAFLSVPSMASNNRWRGP
jgi:hypothetical protein